MEKHYSGSPSDKDRGQNCRQFRGIRMRKWGSWVSEIRMPKTREKIWLGSYKTPEQAARAYDAGVYFLRGPKAKFNFPDSVPTIPSVSSLTRRQIQGAAAKYAMQEIPLTSPAMQNFKRNDQVGREKPASQSQPSLVSETARSCDSQQILTSPAMQNFKRNDQVGREKPAPQSQPSLVSEIARLCDSQQISKAQDLGLWETPFHGNGALNLEKIPSIEEASVLEYIPTWPEEQQDGFVFSDPTDLWNFRDD